MARLYSPDVAEGFVVTRAGAFPVRGHCVEVPDDVQEDLVRGGVWQPYDGQVEWPAQEAKTTKAPEPQSEPKSAEAPQTLPRVVRPEKR